MVPDFFGIHALLFLGVCCLLGLTVVFDCRSSLCKGELNAYSLGNVAKWILIILQSLSLLACVLRAVLSFCCHRSASC